MPSSVCGVSVTRRVHGFSCLVGDCTNDVSRYNHLNCRAILSTVSKYFSAAEFRKLKEMNQVFGSAHIRQVANDWEGCAVVKAPVPPELLRPSYDEAKKMDWV